MPKTKFVCETCGKIYETYETRGKHHYCSKECLKNSPPKEDLTNQVFNRLKVLEYIKNNPTKKRWRCLCECGKEIFTSSYDLKNGKVKSCGCYKQEKLSKQGIKNKKNNRYDLSGEYGIGYTNKGEEFYFDLEDYNLIKGYCWNKTKRGYLTSRKNYKEKTVSFHRFVMKVEDKDKIVDHINRNKLDNRKCNLRICTQQQNCFNSSIPKNNKTGYIGVYFYNQNYFASIKYNRERIDLGVFDNLDEALKTRLQAELKYFGEFAPQKHLFNQFSIKDIEKGIEINV